MTPWALHALDRLGSLVGRTLDRTPVEAVDIDGVPAIWVRAASVLSPSRTILHVHGGGFMFGTPDMYRAAAVRLSAATNSRVLLFDYRHPPHSGVEAMASDCLTVYRWVLAQVPPDELLVSGDSAGGNLAFGMLAGARDAKLAMPAGLVTMSAWLDPDYRHRRGEPRDAFFALRFARRAARLCSDRTGLAAQVRPLDLDLAGLPPTLMQLGSTEPLVPGNRRMADQLAGANVPVTLQLWQDQIHVFQLLVWFLPETRAALAEIAIFADRVAGGQTKIAG
ncbi:alpha/beta hydrolase fold domain-containing protein [Mycolicibacterium sp. Y3]